MQGCCIYVALLKIEPGTPLDFAAATCYIEPKPNNERGRFMAAVTLPTHYRNVFAELGYAQAEIDARIENTFHTIFYGDEAHRFYHPTGPGLAYIEDTGNHDVRTEGMSYGMMLCVQTDHKAEFDALWSWVMHYMYMQDGPNAEVCVRRFWNTPLRDGPRRYYDNCLYFFALLALSGRYRIWPL